MYTTTLTPQPMARLPIFPWLLQLSLHPYYSSISLTTVSTFLVLQKYRMENVSCIGVVHMILQSEPWDLWFFYPLYNVILGWNFQLQFSVGWDSLPPTPTTVVLNDMPGMWHCYCSLPALYAPVTHGQRSNPDSWKLEQQADVDAKVKGRPPYHIYLSKYQLMNLSQFCEVTCADTSQ